MLGIVAVDRLEPILTQVSRVPLLEAAKRAKKQDNEKYCGLQIKFQAAQCFVGLERLVLRSSHGSVAP